MVAAFEIARVCAKSALIFPVALLVYTYALVTLPFHVLLALFRSLTGVGGRTVDELFSSIMLPGGVSANEADTALLRGLREKHNLAMATLRDQLDDSDSRYKVPPPASLGSRLARRPARSSIPRAPFQKRLVASFSPAPFLVSPLLALEPTDGVREASRVRAHAQQDAT